MKLEFHGGAGTVTGSKCLIQTPQAKVLVDAGLFQGFKQFRKFNWSNPKFDVRSIDAVFLTHAHLDHSGYVPKLFAWGYRGPVYCSEGTFDLCKILLPDSGYIQEEDARYSNRKGFSKHHPALPLYTQKDATASLELFSPCDFGQKKTFKDLEYRFEPMGHIVGASSVSLRHQSKEILFSGDVGRSNDLIMKDPSPPGSPNWVVMESTYGDRLHREADALKEMAPMLHPTLERGGVVLIPAFAVGRTQAMIYAFHQLMEKGLIPKVPVYVNSPMATRATRGFCEHSESHKLDPEHCEAYFSWPRYVNSVEESIELNQRKGPMIVVSASGMLTGGRILHHLKSFGTKEENLILFVGYQAPGTRGEALLAKKKSIKIHGSYRRINARVEVLDLFSAHADQDGLLDWLGKVQKPPEKVFLNHGDPAASDSLRKRIEEKFGFDVEVPHLFQEYEI